MYNISIGDTVCLNGEVIKYGKPKFPMTVELINDDIATCVWSDSNNFIQRQSYPVLSLSKCDNIIYKPKGIRRVN